jgi:hypothetical protein
MQVYCKRTARMRHHVTGEIHEIESDEPDWETVGGDERQMGSEIHYEATVEHGELARYPGAFGNIRLVSRTTVTPMVCEQVAGMVEAASPPHRSIEGRVRPSTTRC